MKFNFTKLMIFAYLAVLGGTVLLYTRFSHQKPSAEVMFQTAVIKAAEASITQLPDSLQGNWMDGQKFDFSRAQEEREYWLKIEAPDSHRGKHYLLATIEYVPLVELYRLQDGQFEFLGKSGYYVSFGERMIESNHIIFPLDYSLGRSQPTYFLRLRHLKHLVTSFVSLPEKNLAKAISDLTTTAFLPLSAMVVIFLHTLFYYFFTRHARFASYAVYILCLLFFHVIFNNLHLHFTHGLDSSAFRLRPIAIGVLLLGIHQFMITIFYEPGKKHSLIYHTVQAIVILLVAQNDAVVKQGFVFSAMTVVVFVLLTVGHVLLVERNHPNFKVVAIAWLFVFAGGLATTLAYMSHNETNFWLRNALGMGILFEITLFAIYLGRSYNEERYSRIASQNKVLEYNLKSELASLVQFSMINSRISLPQLSLHTLYRPAENIGGDLVCAMEDKEQEIVYLFIGDVSGHGISAALVSAHVVGMIKSDLFGSFPGPDEFEARIVNLYKKINSSLIADETEVMLSLLGIAIDLRSFQAVSVNAGHHPILLGTRGQGRFLLRPGSVLGVLNEIRFKPTRIDLSEVDVLFFYTDGILENRGGGSQVITKEDLKEIVENHAPREVISILEARTQEIWGEKNPEDDYTAVTISLHRLPRAS